MSAESQRQVEGLVTILGLQKRAREAESLDELGFIFANESRNLIPYRHCIHWQTTGRRGKVQAISGVPRIEKDAPMVRWLQMILSILASQTAGIEPQKVAAIDIPQPAGKEWQEWLPDYALYVPLRHPTGRSMGALLITREEPFQQFEIDLLQHLSGCYAHAWEAMARGPRLSDGLGSVFGVGRAAAVLMVLAAVTMFVPVRLSSLAPAEIVPYEPWVLRASLDGVVKSLHVRPSQTVKKGQPVLELDTTNINNELTIARRKLSVMDAEFRQVAQKAVFDAEAKSRLTLLNGKRGLQAAKIDYLRSILERSTMTAHRSGIAIFSASTDWKGRPVRTGEPILTVADPAKVRLEIMIPVDDAITLKEGSEVRFFQAIAPDVPLSAVIELAAYRAKLTNAGTMAFRVTARLSGDNPPPRIGLTGTAKVFGDEVSLLFFLFRRPFATVRRWLGQ